MIVDQFDDIGQHKWLWRRTTIWNRNAVNCDSTAICWCSRSTRSKTPPPNRHRTSRYFQNLLICLCDVIDYTHTHRSRVSIRKWTNRRIFYRPLVTRSYRHWRSVCGWPKPNWTSTIIIPCCLSTKRWTICPARPPPVAKVRALADWTDCDLFRYPPPLSNNIPANMLLFVFFYI